MRIAFLTAEFVTDYPDGGGLGQYAHRMAKLLVEHGHDVEVFVPSSFQPPVLMHNGIRVERVPIPSKRRVWEAMIRIVGVVGLHESLALTLQARALARAMERRHRTAPFDLVQSSDFMAVGLAVRRKTGRVHLVRCSVALDLYNEIDGGTARSAHWRVKLERAAMNRADQVYAPSRFVADHFRKNHGIEVAVVRPPLVLETKPADEVPFGLPEKFLVHFGQLMRRKGTFWLAKSLEIAFVQEPSLRMIWIGPTGEYLGKLLSGLGRNRSKLLVLHPLPKPELYAIVQRAVAAVQPSLVDNLPNTVIESLVLGVPVIGTRGASIDELVEPGVTGELVAPDDVDGLAAAMVKVWRGESRVRRGFTWSGGIADEMRPECAVENLLKLAAQARARSGQNIVAPSAPSAKTAPAA